MIIPEDISSELTYFTGLVSTDGHMQRVVDRSHYRLAIYTSEKEEVELISKLIFQLFNYNASINPRKTGFANSRINYEIYISKKDIVMFVNSLGIPFGAKSANFRLPKKLLEDEKFIWDYIRGVFDGDGSIIFSGKDHIFKITSGSLLFLEDLRKIFMDKGFTKFKIWKDKRGNIWDLRNNTKSEISKLYEKIYNNASFFYPRKKLKWESQHI